MPAGAPRIDRESAVYAIVLGRIVATLRERRAWTQAQLGSAAGLTQSTISRVERGALLPDAYAFRGLAEAFEMSAANLNASVERAMTRSQKTCESTIPAPAGTPWWQTALGVAGVIGLTGLIAFAVAAALDDKKDNE